MDPRIREALENQRDKAVAWQLNDDWQSIFDIVRRGFRVGTVRASLKRLEQDGIVQKRWDGNSRYGRYIYKFAR